MGAMSYKCLLGQDGAGTILRPPYVRSFDYCTSCFSAVGVLYYLNIGKHELSNGWM